MRCYLDMDGVLVDFIGGANRAHGKEDPFLIEANRGTYAVEELWGMTPKEFWEPLNSLEFWENLEKTPECDEIIELACNGFGDENVCILTAPSEFEGCMVAKQRWMKKHYPEFVKRTIFAAAGTKQFIGGPEKLLIDDRDSNVEEWRKAGGRGILLPRPWNKLHHQSDHPMRWLKEELQISYLQRRANVQRSS